MYLEVCHNCGLTMLEVVEEENSVESSFDEVKKSNTSATEDADSCANSGDDSDDLFEFEFANTQDWPEDRYSPSSP